MRISTITAISRVKVWLVERELGNNLIEHNCILIFDIKVCC